MTGPSIEDPDGPDPDGPDPDWPDPDAHLETASELLALAVGLAEAAAELVAAGRGSEVGAWVTGTKSSPTDFVTEVDRASERLIVDGIRRARPDDGILGEEGSVLEGTSGVRWVIDPLDGTTNFVYGLPAYAVSIAVEQDGRTIAAAVVDAARAETFTATIGGGAWLGSTRLRCRAGADLALALVGTGFSYDAERRRHQGAVAAQLLPEIRDLRRVGAAAIDLCWVAAGRLDAFYERGLQPWDLAAGALVAAEAGAEVSDLDGGPPSGVFTLAAPPPLAARLRDRLGQLGAADGG